MQATSIRLIHLTIRSLFILVVLVFANLVSANDDSILLKDGTIHSMDGKAPFVGSILIVDGKIKNIGERIKPPKGAKVINLKGYQIAPGLIDCRSKLWLTESSLRDTGGKADVEVELGIDPWQDNWQDLASQGITSVYVQPASGGLMGGYGSWLNVGPFDSVEAIVLKSKTGLQSSLGLSGNSQARSGQIKSLGKLLETAKKELDKEKNADKPPTPRDKTSEEKSDDEKESPKKKNDKPGDAKDENESDKKDEKKTDDDKKVKKDPLKIALRKLLKRETSLSVEVHHPDTAKGLLELAKKYKIRVVLEGLSKIGSSSVQLSESNIPFVAGPLMKQVSPPAYRKGASYSWLAKEANQNGRLWAISGYPTTAIQSRELRLEAAMAVRHGVSRASVLSALTINPARMFGAAEQIGSIEIGKAANLAVFAGDPVDSATPVRLTICQGMITHDVQHPAPKALEVQSSKATSVPEVFPPSFKLKSSRILAPNGTYQKGVLAIKEGKFVELKELDQETPLIDLQDHVITPGLVNAWCTLGQEATIWDSTESDMSHVSAIDGLDPDTKKSREMLAAGVIHIGVPPTDKSTSSGVLGHLRLGATNYVAKSACASQFVLAASARNSNRFPASLATQTQLIEGLFEKQFGATQVYLPGTLADAVTQIKADNIRALRYFKDVRKSIFLVSQEAEIETAIQLGKRYSLKSVIVTRADLRKFVDKIDKTSFSLIVPDNRSAFDETIEQYVVLNSKGVSVAISSASPDGIRLTGSMLANAGMPRANVRKALDDQWCCRHRNDVGCIGRRKYCGLRYLEWRPHRLG